MHSGDGCQDVCAARSIKVSTSIFDPLSLIMIGDKLPQETREPW